MLIAEAGVAIAVLCMGAFAFKQSLRTRPSTTRMFRVCIGVGLLAGAYLSFGVVWQTEKIRFLGAPLTVAIFQLSGSGYWEDYVGPMTLPFAVVNFAVGFFLPHLCAWVWTRLRGRQAPSTSAS